ncbi:hypothetical protein K461DRAFT_102895 [Myriangium duriaei CBS 260.36]|uniref:Uncharacterized protein n=1 Tax=Myriangium duriaei CBS 260.36 TaxID=1168546 RepID=A0A9P4MPN0_9PEZI|nr:hypothetical protein K461DRAFT_102895 [Myriangium duriaei CBS 260.36]
MIAAAVSLQITSSCFLWALHCCVLRAVRLSATPSPVRRPPTFFPPLFLRIAPSFLFCFPTTYNVSAEQILDPDTHYSSPTGAEVTATARHEYRATLDSRCFATTSQLYSSPSHLTSRDRNTPSASPWPDLHLDHYLC